MTDLSDRPWRLIRDDPRDGPTQMALEEIAAETALARDLRTVRVFSWAPSTLSVGYNQDADTVDWEYCQREGIEVTRRQTGGGGIYHDHVADISYTIVAPASEVPGDLMACYEQFCDPILTALELMGVAADFAASPQDALYQPACYLRAINPAHDVVATADGRKLSGNAQYRTRDAVIQHGSIRYACHPERHVGVFATDLAPETFSGRVTSIRDQADIEREAALEILAETLGEWCNANAGEWSNRELAAADQLATEKYDDAAWIHDRETDSGAQ